MTPKLLQSRLCKNNPWKSHTCCGYEGGEERKKKKDKPMNDQQKAHLTKWDPFIGNVKYIFQKRACPLFYWYLKTQVNLIKQTETVGGFYCMMLITCG